ncbi:Hypothetical_protein [Hexamita inflata]|uniref:Hypothetical_protein n=1 Tax=Hexamita inflata TaxID=28002 RepID=A0AA86PCR1_9EUKA|nr:Hypothetical protein HINF_LOCUS24036 [Hexamita inflata]
MISKIGSVVLNIITALCLGLYVLSTVIVLFAYSYVSVDYYCKIALFIVFCIIQAIAPWVKFVQVYFKFMIQPFWRAWFVFMLGIFQFPSFMSVYWSYLSSSKTYVQLLSWSLVFPFWLQQQLIVKQKIQLKKLNWT